MARYVRFGIGALAIGASAVAVASAAGVHYLKTTSFAGYEFSSSKVASVSARFTIPTITCSPQSSGVGPGAFVITSRRVGRVTEEYLNGAGLIVACQNNIPSYRLATAVAGSEMNSSVTIRPGDVVRVQVHVSAHATSVTVTDLTLNQSQPQSGPGAKPSYVSVGTAAIAQGGVQLGVDRFSTVAFSDVVINGHTLAWWKPYAVERYRVEARKQVIQIRPSAIARGGESFTLGFVHA